jgi:hypothetical protein
VLADALALGPEDRARLVAAAARPADLRGSPGRSLPGWLASFVGRQRELTEVERPLGQARLLTLLGPGGTRKTRLALAAAERLPDACSGSWPSTPARSLDDAFAVLTSGLRTAAPRHQTLRAPRVVADRAAR